MTPEFVRCEFCRSEILSETCKLAAYGTVIEGKQYIFCCERCAQQYREKKKKKTK